MPRTATNQIRKGGVTAVPEVHADGRKWTEWKRLGCKLSVNFVNAVEAVDGALVLLAADRLPLALILIDNAVELVLKAQLEGLYRLSPDFIIEDLSAEERRSLLARCQKSVDELPGVNPVVSLEKETFWDVYKQLLKFHEAQDENLLRSWQPDISRMRDLRNEIQHDGPDVRRTPDILNAVLLTGLPFLEDFFKSAVDISLSSTCWPLYREVEVAIRTARRLHAKGHRLNRRILDTVALKRRYNVQDDFSSGYDGEPPQRDWDYEYNRRWQHADEYQRRFRLNEWHRIECRICFEQGFLHTEVYEDSDQIHLHGFRCAMCYASLDNTVPYLLEEHLQLTDEELQEIRKAWGIS